jgi:hypothetical protein
MINKHGIVITTHDSTSEFLFDLLDSLKGLDFPVVVVKNTESNNGFELAGIHVGMQLFDEFLYLQDSVLIKNSSFIETIFSPEYKNVSVALFPEFNAYLGKYITSILKRMNVPVVHNKREAVDNERIFTQDYISNCNYYLTYFPEINAWKPSNRFEFKHDRMNCVYENDYIVKYKGTWKGSQVK